MHLRSGQRQLSVSFDTLTRANYFRWIWAVLIAGFAAFEQAAPVVPIVALTTAYLGGGLLVLHTVQQNSESISIALAVQTLLDITLTGGLVFISAALFPALSILLSSSLLFASLALPLRTTAALIAVAGITLLVVHENVFESAALVSILLTLPLIKTMLRTTDPDKEQLISTLPLGLVITDSHDHVITINPIATRMFAREKLDEEISTLLSHWRTTGKQNRQSSYTTSRSRIIPIIEETDDYSILVLLDTDSLEEQAQDVKITALGRLTASIAHEIRNPLGAVSHAAQLLQESAELRPADHRLTEIIRQQTMRMNAIVEDVMQLGRRNHARPQWFKVDQWLHEFVEAFCQTREISAAQIQLKIDNNNRHMTIDPDHLHQILTNLCTNAVKHGKPLDEQHLFAIQVSGNDEEQSLYIDVIDGGDPVDNAVAKQIFEPFFTTKSTGSGLGLYIARELCEANNARIKFIDKQPTGNCFRLNLLNQTEITVR